jgi:plastocyanin
MEQEENAVSETQEMPKKSANYLLFAVPFLIIVGIVLSKNLNKTEGISVLSPTSTPTVESASDTDGIEFVVSASNFEFDQKVITVNKGDEVKITLKNTEGKHDLMLDEFNVKTSELEADESETVTFIADKAGEFEYYCSVGEHRKMGMVGKLIVK